MPSSDDSNELTPYSSQPPSIQRRPIQSKPATASIKSVNGVLSNIGDSAVTSRAEDILSSTDEDMTWQERPSLVLLIPRALKYVVMMAVIIVLCSLLHGWTEQRLQRQAAAESARVAANLAHEAGIAKKSASKSAKAKLKQEQEQAASAATPDATQPAAIPHGESRFLWGIQYGFGGLFALLFIGYFLRLKTTKYAASSQRLIVEDGFMHSVNRPYELHHLGDAVITKPLLLRLFGVSNLVILQPRIELIGLRNPEYVRDLIRQAGQLEAQRVDKIRWR